MKKWNGWQVAALVCTLSIAGCKSAADKANEAAIAQASQQATATNSPQQVVWNDKDGNTVTTVIQPPAPGQAVQQVLTTTTKHVVSGNQTSNTTTTASSTMPVQGPVVAANAAPVPLSAPVPVAGPTAPVISPVELDVPRGTILAIRIDQHISVKHSRAGDRFSGEMVHDVIGSNDSRVAIPKGTRVNGIVDASHRRGHFKGRSILELRLTSMELNGQRYDLDTRDNVRTKKGKGKRSTAFIGGGHRPWHAHWRRCDGRCRAGGGRSCRRWCGHIAWWPDWQSRYRNPGGKCDELPPRRRSRRAAKALTGAYPSSTLGLVTASTCATAFASRACRGSAFAVSTRVYICSRRTIR